MYVAFLTLWVVLLLLPLSAKAQVLEPYAGAAHLSFHRKAQSMPKEGEACLLPGGTEAIDFYPGAGPSFTHSFWHPEPGIFPAEGDVLPEENFQNLCCRSSNGIIHQDSFHNKNKGFYFLSFRHHPPYRKTYSGKSTFSGRMEAAPLLLKGALTTNWWVYLLCLFTGFAMVYAWLRLLWSRARVQRQLMLAHSRVSELEEQDKTRTRYFTNIVHELRTALTLVKGPISRIGQQTSDSRLKARAQQATYQADTMLKLVNQLLELSRIESGAEKLRLFHADLVQLLTLVTEEFKPFAERQGIHLSFLTDRDSLMMDFDPDIIQKILHNLLSNAFKFTPRGGNVTLSLRKDPSISQENVTIALTDTGIGISAEDLPHVFDRFYQARSSLSGNSGGTGIGLSYVKELVALHGGSIEVRSKPGESSCFQFSLPVRQPESSRKNGGTVPEVQVPPINQTVSGNGKPAPDNGLASPSFKPRILLIEDHKEMAEFVSACLAEEYKVYCACDGAEGYQKAILKVPDLIITDLILPKTSGLSLIRKLKRHKLTCHIPLVILTARSTAKECLQGRESGADAFLTKPFSVEELCLVLKNLLNLRNSIAEKINQSLKGETDNPFPEVQGEDSFLCKFSRIAEANMSDEKFGINELLREIGMSRTQLHRKVKATTGQSANELLRTMKLKKALLLLQTTRLPIAEIAAQVGFGSASHFTKIFGKHFGFLPSAVREKHGSN